MSALKGKVPAEDWVCISVRSYKNCSVSHLLWQYYTKTTEEN